MSRRVWVVEMLRPGRAWTVLTLHVRRQAARDEARWMRRGARECGWGDRYRVVPYVPAEEVDDGE